MKGCPVEGPQPLNMLVRTLPRLQALPLPGVLSSEQHSSPVVATGEPRRILAMPGPAHPTLPLRGLLTQLCLPLTRCRNNGPAFSCKLRVPDGDQPHVLKEMRNKRPDGAGLGGHRAALQGQGRPGLSLPRSVIQGWGRKSIVGPWPLVSTSQLAERPLAPGGFRDTAVPFTDLTWPVGGPRDARNKETPTEASVDPGLPAPARATEQRVL